MLLDFNIDTEDFKVIQQINIPYIFQYDSKQNEYIAGPLLQGKKWFDYYLNTLGLEFKESVLRKRKLLPFWRRIIKSV